MSEQEKKKKITLSVTEDTDKKISDWFCCKVLNKE